MKRELGIAKCGLACCLCSENTYCKGCADGEGHEFCQNRSCAEAHGCAGCHACAETGCQKGLLSKIKPRSFCEFIRRYGEEALLDCLERNEQNGVVYHRDGIFGDYDYFDTVEEAIEFIQNGK